MIPFGRLFGVEVRRALSRRAVWLLIGVALVGIALTGLIAFAGSNDFDAANPEPDIARLTDLWVAGGADGALTATLLFLAVGAILGGATVTGAEWQHGTIVTVTTWEVRRVRLLLARILSAILLAGLIGLALLVLFCLSLAPTYLVRGTTAGADAEFWRELAWAVGRISALTALAAGLGAALASIGRRTTVAIGVAFAYLAVLETTVRAQWPERGRWLLAENSAVLVTASDLEGAAFTRSVGTAALTLCGYVIVLVAVALLLFRRRDLAGSSYDVIVAVGVLVVLAGAAVVAVALRLSIGTGATVGIVAVAGVTLVMALALFMGGVDGGGGDSGPAAPVATMGDEEPVSQVPPLRTPEVRLTAPRPDALPPVPRAVGDLEPGAAVVLRMAGLDAGSTATVHQCLAGATEPGGCRAGLPVNIGEAGSATVLVDLAGAFEPGRGAHAEVVDCERERCAIVVFGSPRLEVETVFGRPAPPPAGLVVEPVALPPGSSVTAVARGLEPGARATFVVCRPGGQATADCGAPTAPVTVDAAGRAGGEVTVTAGRCPRGGRCAVAVQVGDSGPRAFARLVLLGRSGATYDGNDLAAGLGLAAVLLLSALWLLRHTDWTPVGGDPFAGIELPDDPFGPDVDP